MDNYRNNRTAREIFEFAKEKGTKQLTNDRQMITLFADMDYVLLRYDNKIYIGSNIKDSVNPFFKNRDMYDFGDNYKMQFLTRVKKY